ncbi:MAG TPA: DUF6232 family protein [Myxococcales bacterium]|nr:DUF6232 family protein [Myxococcales bacterium]
MPAQILVMCEACGRPQFPRKGGCVQCGAPLPEQPTGLKRPATPKEKLFDAFEPFLEGDFGRAGTVLLSQRRLEWQPGPGSREEKKTYPLVDVAQVELERRPAWEALLVAALPGIAAALVSSPVARWILLGLVGFAALACFTQRRYALFVRRRDGKDPLGLLLAVGTSGSPAVQRVLSVWESLSAELRSLGVKVLEPS